MQFVLQLQFLSGGRPATCVERHTSDKRADVFPMLFERERERLIKSVWQFAGEGTADIARQEMGGGGGVQPADATRSTRQA
jgi:hypothetical protein